MKSCSSMMILSTLWFWRLKMLLIMTCKISQRYFKAKIYKIFHIRGVSFFPSMVSAWAPKFPPSQKIVYLETGVLTRKLQSHRSCKSDEGLASIKSDSQSVSWICLYVLHGNFKSPNTYYDCFYFTCINMNLVCPRCHLLWKALTWKQCDVYACYSLFPCFSIVYCYSAYHITSKMINTAVNIKSRIRHENHKSYLYL